MNCYFSVSAQEDLLNLVSTNSEFRQSITAATTAEEAVRLAAVHGIEISVEDLRTAFQSKMSELSQEELEAVSGGKACHASTGHDCAAKQGVAAADTVGLLPL
jgi:predicted ribosomally synthesized peptide with nif11-like leader